MWYMGIKDIEAATPISAINQFHRYMQLDRGFGDYGSPALRPELKPAEYRVLSFAHVYHNAALHRDIAAQPIIESQIDYPQSPNPDLLHPDRIRHPEVDWDGKGDPEFDFGPNKGKDI